MIFNQFDDFIVIPFVSCSNISFRTSFIIALFIILNTFAVCFQFYFIANNDCTGVAKGFVASGGGSIQIQNNVVPTEFCEVGKGSMWVRVYSFMLNPGKKIDLYVYSFIRIQFIVMI